MMPVAAMDVEVDYDPPISATEWRGGEVEDQTVDPAAPWGINPDTGRPYTKSPEERAAWGERMKLAREAARAAGRGRSAKTPPRTRGAAGRPASGRPAAPKAPPPELAYADTAAGLIALPAMGLAIAGKLLKSDALILDSVALSYHSGPIAQAVGEAAAARSSWLSQALDKAAEVGPGATVLMAVVPLLLQVLGNHGMVKPTEGGSVLTAEELMAAVKPPGDEADA